MTIETTYLALAVVVAGLVFLVHTAFFLYKLTRSSGRDYEHIYNEEMGKVVTESEEYLSGTVPISSTEVTCFMGIVWSSCVYNNRMAKSTFIGWYLTMVMLDTGLAIAFYFILTLVK